MLRDNLNPKIFIHVKSIFLQQITVYYKGCLFKKNSQYFYINLSRMFVMFLQYIMTYVCTLTCMFYLWFHTFFHIRHIYIQVNNNRVIRENDCWSLRVIRYHYRIVYVHVSIYNIITSPNWPFDDKDALRLHH